MDKKETGEYEEEKGTGSEAKKMGNERMGENEEVCPFENILFCPGTLTTVKSPLRRSGLFCITFSAANSNVCSTNRDVQIVVLFAKTNTILHKTIN